MLIIRLQQNWAILILSIVPVLARTDTNTRIGAVLLTNGAVNRNLITRQLTVYLQNGFNLGKWLTVL